MRHVLQVDSATAFIIKLPSNNWLVSAAHGTVSSSGWHDAQLSPRFYIAPPTDGIWDFDFVARPPGGIALDVVLPIAGAYAGHAPSWVKGVRIHSATNSIEVKTSTSAKLVAPVDLLRVHAATTKGHVLVEHVFAVYDDSIQPTGTIHWTNEGPFGLPVPHVEMKKLRHELTLVVEGHDEAKIRECINSSIQAGTVAAIIAAFITGGWAAAEAFVSAVLTSLLGCLGSGYTAQINDRSHWIYWDS